MLNKLFSYAVRHETTEKKRSLVIVNINCCPTVQTVQFLLDIYKVFLLKQLLRKTVFSTPVDLIVLFCIDTGFLPDLLLESLSNVNIVIMSLRHVIAILDVAGLGSHID